MSLKNTCVRVSFNKVAGPQACHFFKKRFHTSVFWWHLRYFQKHLFWRTSVNNYFCSFSQKLRSVMTDMKVRNISNPFRLIASWNQFLLHTGKKIQSQVLSVILVHNKSGKLAVGFYRLKSNTPPRWLNLFYQGFRFNTIRLTDVFFK